jgi:hypothetical protein
METRSFLNEHHGDSKRDSTLKKEVATDYKTIEELLKVSDIRTLRACLKIQPDLTIGIGLHI